MKRNKLPNVVPDRIVDLTGRRFGKWTVRRYARYRHRNHYWWCWCDCGGVWSVEQKMLVAGRSNKCGDCRGFHQRRANDQRGDLAYGTWQSMNKRCHDPNHVSYQWYGARGIKVCKRWRWYGAGFVNFVADVGERPSERHSIDRIDPDGDYRPGNCRWATAKQQAANRRPHAPGRKTLRLR